MFNSVKPGARWNGKGVVYRFDIRDYWGHTLIDTSDSNYALFYGEDFQYAEAAQLPYTLTRQNVYNAIMAILGYSHDFEDELGVDKSKGMNSYDYMVTSKPMTIDSRFFWRADEKRIRSRTPARAITHGKAFRKLIARAASKAAAPQTGDPTLYGS